MIQYTEAEKQAAKQAKIAFKKNQQPKIPMDLKVAEKAKHPVYILSGIVDGETVLLDSHPVYWDYLYVVDDNGGKVIRSDIQGSIRQLKADLQRQGFEAKNIYNCNMSARNFF
jgi:hypothetical protein